MAPSAADPSGAEATGGGTHTEGRMRSASRPAVAVPRSAPNSASDRSKASPSADISAAAWSAEISVTGAAGVLTVGAPATGSGCMPSRRSTVDRSRAVVVARSRITAVKRVDRSPTGGGEAIVSASAAWDAVSDTAESRPCWRTPLAVWGNLPLVSVAASAMRADSCAPVRVEAWPTWSARAA